MNDKNARNAVDDTCDMHGPIELDKVIEAEKSAIDNRRKAWFTEGDTLGDEDCFFGVGLSGGGIRSASFCLGALQALDAFGLIKRTDYLSTVSGGGYIGTGMVASMTRHAEEQPRGVNGKPEYFFPYGAKKDKKIELRQIVQDNEAISHLRDHSKFLIPHGISDVLLSLGVLARGLAVNLFLILTVIVPLAAITIITNPTRAHLGRSVVLDIFEKHWAWLAACWPAFLQSFGLSKILGLVFLIYLVIWGIRRSCLERDCVSRSGLDAVPAPGTLTAQRLMMAMIVAFAFEVQGPILQWLFEVLSRSEAAQMTLPSAYALLVSVVGVIASGRSKLIGLIQKAPADPGLGAFVKAAISRLLLMLAGLIVPFLVYVAYLGLSLWGIAAWPFIDYEGLFSFKLGFLSGVLHFLGQSGQPSCALSCQMPASWMFPLAPGFVVSPTTPYVLAAMFACVMSWHAFILLFTRRGNQILLLLARRLRDFGGIQRKLFTIALVASFFAFLALAAHATRADFPTETGAEAMAVVLHSYVFASLLVVAAAFLFSPNANSLHSLYRDRLSVAFRLGQSRHYDSKPMKLTKLTNYAPYLLVNATLNARVASASGNDDVPVKEGDSFNAQSNFDPVKRGRNAEFFLFSKHYTGSDSTGYTRTASMQAIDSNLSLAAAAAISGAAFTSNMGRANINALSLTFALLNVRLGYWLSNPKYCRRKVCDLPTNLPWHDFFRAYLIAEAFGLLRTDSSKIYVTDGGHVDNLGLYQLLRRKCRVILIIDAEADPAMYFGALVDVQRFARIDLGYRINLDFTGMQAAAAKRREVNAGNTAKGTQVAETDPVHADHFAIGEIDYGDGKEKGVLVYVKALVTGDEPDYVLDYERRYPSFPHESTGDQFFSEEQMEAYRALGFHAVERMFSTPMRPKWADSKLPEKRAAVTRAFAVREKVRAVKTKLGIRAETLKD